ncbi:MAG: hypothetical protein ACLQLC_04880 [Candidatus Sulfotelmatobacter sp.]
MKNVSKAILAAGLMFACVLAMAQAAARPPEVHLDADGLAPRPIEELTGTRIAQRYAIAWQDLAQALESGHPGNLGDDFTGFAKDRLLKRVAEQNRTGLRVRIVDHGHSLKAVFYSEDGSAMQLLDTAQLEIQTYDGTKLLDTQNTPHTYMVLMTPGADRWYIRDLEEVSGKP